MRAARAARDEPDHVVFGGPNKHARLRSRESRPLSPGHLSLKPLRLGRVAPTSQPPTANPRRVAKGPATKRSRAVVRTVRGGGVLGSVPHDAAARFPMPYPGVGQGRPPQALPVAGARHRHPEKASSERHRASIKEPRGEAVRDSPGTASKRRKRPRSANVALCGAVTGGISGPPPTLASRAREHAKSPLSKALSGTNGSKVPTTKERYGDGDVGHKKLSIRPASAPSRRDDRDKSGGGGVLMALSRMADGSYNAPDELRIMKWVVLRETYITKLHGVVATGRKRAKSAARNGGTSDVQNNAKRRPKLFGLLMELLTVLRRITVEIVEAIQRWRGMNREKPFIWGSSNYLVKMADDVAFLSRLPGLEQHLGVSISNNPFLCHVRLDGGPAFLPSDAAEHDGRERAVGRVSRSVFFGGSTSLGVSAERVEAAAAVLHGEVIRAHGMRSKGRPDHSDNCARTGIGSTAAWNSEKDSKGTQSQRVPAPLDTAGDSGAPPPDDESPHDDDGEAYHEDDFVAKETSNYGDHVRVSQEGGHRPSVREHDGDGETYHEEGFVAEETSNYGDHGPVSQEGGRRPTVREPTSASNEENDTAMDAEGDAPEQHAYEEPDPMSMPQHSNEGAVRSFPPVGAEIPDLQDGTPGRMGRRGSPFMAVFSMCDGMITDLQGLGRISESAEGHDGSPTHGTVGLHGGPSLVGAGTDEEEGSRGPPIERPLDFKGSLDVRKEDHFLYGTAYEHQTKKLFAEGSSVKHGRLQKLGGSKESDAEREGRSHKWYIEQLKGKTPEEMKAEYFSNWVERTEAHLQYRDARAARHHRRGQLRRAMAVWDKHRASVLGGRLAEAFAGRFGLSTRHYVRVTFDALRAYARGARLTARNRATMRATCARFEYAGRYRVRQAWQRWLHAAGQRDPEYEEALARLCQLWVKCRLRVAFNILRPPAPLRKTRSVAALAGRIKAAGSFAAKASTAASKTATMREMISSNEVTKEDSWAGWLGDEGSVSFASPSEQGETARGGTYDRGRPTNTALDNHEGKENLDGSQQSSKISLRGLGARIKAIKSFRDVRDKTQAQRQGLRSTASFGSLPGSSTAPTVDPAVANVAISVVDALQMKSVSATRSLYQRQAAEQQSGETAAIHIQHAWRASRERRVAARIANSVFFIQQSWRIRSTRDRAGVRIVRAWRRRVAVRVRTLDRALVEAAGDGDMRAVAFLLRPATGWKVGADVNATGANGATALHAACRYESPGTTIQANDAARSRSGSVLTLSDSSKFSPYGRSGDGGSRDRPDWVGVIRALVEAGAVVEARDDRGLTPMMTAAGEGGGEMIAALAAFGAEVDTAEEASGRRTPLVIAAQRANASATAALLEYGARANLTVGDGLTPLHEAVGAGSTAVAEILVRAGANVNATSESAGMTPLHLAVANNQHAAARLLVHSGADVCRPDARGLTPLRLTVEMADAPTVALLLAAEPPADLSVEDENGGTVLHAACRLGLTDIAQLLLGAGADPHTRDARGRTPELVALDLGHADCAALFYQIEIRSFVPQSNTQATTGSTDGDVSTASGDLDRRIIGRDRSNDRAPDFEHEGGGDEPRGDGGADLAALGVGREEEHDSDANERAGEEDQQEQEAWNWTAEAGGVSPHQAAAGAQRSANVQAEQQRVSVSSSLGEAKASWIHPPPEPESSWRGTQDQTGIREGESERSGDGLIETGHQLQGGSGEGEADGEEGEWEWSETEGWKRRLRGDPYGPSTLEGQVEMPSSYAVTFAEDRGPDHQPRQSESYEESYRYDEEQQHQQQYDPLRQEDENYNNDRRRMEDGSDAPGYHNRTPSTHEWKDYGDYGAGVVVGRPASTADEDNVDDGRRTLENGQNESSRDYWETSQGDINAGWPSTPRHAFVDYEGPAPDEGGEVHQVEALSHADWTPPQGQEIVGWGDIHVDDGGSMREPETHAQHQNQGVIAANEDKAGDEGEVSPEEPKPTPRSHSSEGGESQTRASQGSREWGGLRAILRAGNIWMSMLDRESGSVYYQNERTGLTQWEVPEDGEIVPSERVHGDVQSGVA